ncbi:MAG: hypothetical protein J6112_01665 [Clostridia bacterium]|nr:hypothetical protein [Clostridia bacterium]
MFDYREYFDRYCQDHKLELILSFDMPGGYETAEGTFDLESRTVFINAEYLKEAPDHVKAYCLFHELRHASQYLCPEQFGAAVIRSSRYVIMFDGTCYKLVDGKYHECRLEGGAELFTELYLGQPYEVDANEFAFEQAKKFYGDQEELQSLYESRMPERPLAEGIYDSIYAFIDEKIKASDRRTDRDV